MRLDKKGKRLRTFTHVFQIVVIDSGAPAMVSAFQSAREPEGRLNLMTIVSSKLNLGWASAKFNKTHIGVPKRAINLIGAEVSLTYAPNHRFYLRPHFEFTHISNGRLRRYLVSPTIGNFGLALGINL